MTLTLTGNCADYVGLWLHYRQIKHSAPLTLAVKVGIEPTVGLTSRRINSPLHYHSAHFTIVLAGLPTLTLGRLLAVSVTSKP